MDATHPAAEHPHRRRRRWRRAILYLAILYAAVAYVVIPWAWERYARRHPSLDANPRITETGDGHPGDPLNVALVGDEAEVRGIMQAAQWHEAAALGLESDLRIAADAVLSRPDADAPVSSLYLFGRKEDLAFEQPVGDSPRHRHHVRLWKTAAASADGRPVWIGSAVYDERVGISRTSGQITHVTAPDVDAERDYLLDCLSRTGRLADRSVEVGFHTQRQGRNGGGDPWHTDGNLDIGIIAPIAP